MAKGGKKNRLDKRALTSSHGGSTKQGSGGNNNVASAKKNKTPKKNKAISNNGDGSNRKMSNKNNNNNKKGVYGRIDVAPTRSSGLRQSTIQNTKDSKVKRNIQLMKNSPARETRSSSSSSSSNNNNTNIKNKRKKRKISENYDDDNHYDAYYDLLKAAESQIASMSNATYGDYGSLNQSNNKKKNKSNNKNNNSSDKKKRKKETNYTTTTSSRNQSSFAKKIFLPTVNFNQEQCPWWNSPSEIQQQQQQEEEEHMWLLNSSFKVNANAMRQLDQELESFARYVRLTPPEQRARLYMIEQVQTIAERLFRLDHPERSVQVFGSFICPSVCIYQSDIDLAIWDVVPPQDPQTNDNVHFDSVGRRRENSHIRFGENGTDQQVTSTSSTSSTGVGSSSTTTTSGELSDKAQRKARIQQYTMKWMAAFDDMDKLERGQDGKQEEQTDDEKQCSGVSTDNQGNEKDDTKESANVNDNEEEAGEEEIAKVTEDDDTGSDEKESSEGITSDVKDDHAEMFVIDRTGVTDTSIDCKNDTSEEQLLLSTPLKESPSEPSKTPVISNREGSSQENNGSNQFDALGGASHAPDTIQNASGNDQVTVDSTKRETGSDVQSNGEDNHDDSDNDTADPLGALDGRNGHSVAESGSNSIGKSLDGIEGKVEIVCKKPTLLDDVDEVQYLGTKKPASSRREIQNESTKGGEAANEDDEDYTDDEVVFAGRKRPRGQSIISLCSATTCSDADNEDKWDDSGMEVSYTVRPSAESRSAKRFKLEGRARTLVVNALYKLARPLNQFAARNSLNVRKHASVPIINLQTRFGYECDIAIGGHNGSDTSSFATVQASRFESFSTVVVILKILLSQHRMDKPFTGGIGSFALYVLVASHIEQHVNNGGGEGPAELLFSFLFRYGNIKHSHKNIESWMRTFLRKGTRVVMSDGTGMTDMTPCYQVENCVNLFSSCWRKLYERLQIRKSFNTNHSIIQYLIDSIDLDTDRSMKKKSAIDHLKTTLGHDVFHKEMQAIHRKQQASSIKVAVSSAANTRERSMHQKEGNSTFDNGENELEDVPINVGLPAGLPPLALDEFHTVMPVDPNPENTSDKTSSTISKTNNKKKKKNKRSRNEDARSGSSAAPALSSSLPFGGQRRRPPYKRMKTW